MPIGIVSAKGMGMGVGWGSANHWTCSWVDVQGMSIGWRSRCGLHAGLDPRTCRPRDPTVDGTMDGTEVLGGGGVARGHGVGLFAFGGADWPLAPAHSDPLWVRTCFWGRGTEGDPPPPVLLTTLAQAQGPFTSSHPEPQRERQRPMTHDSAPSHPLFANLHVS